MSSDLNRIAPTISKNRDAKGHFIFKHDHDDGECTKWEHCHGCGELFCNKEFSAHHCCKESVV